MKIYRIDEAAELVNLPVSVIKCLEQEGRLRPKERIGDVSYYEQSDLDSLIQALHSSLQKASWREMELRMEAVEQRLEAMERMLQSERQATSSSSSPLTRKVG